MSGDDFKLFDVDGKGYISPSDLDNALKKINKEVSATYRKEIFNAADKNGDGKVDPAEFRAMMTREGDVTPASDIVDAFDRLSGTTAKRARLATSTNVSRNIFCSHR